MWYIIIGVIIIILVAVLPFSIRNRTKQKQEEVSKKAETFGVELDFGDRKNAASVFRNKH